MALTSGRALPLWAEIFNDEMGDFWSGEVRWNQPLAPYTTYNIGGPAEGMVFPGGINEIAYLIQGLRKLDLPWRVIGGGSNILVADEGLAGMTLVFRKSFGKIKVVREVNDKVYVRVQAGCSLGKLVSWALDQGLSGLEFATGIPGTVGGALRMNAGAWGAEICQLITSVTVMGGEGCYCIKGQDDLNFSYRSWGEGPGRLAMEAVLQLKRRPRDQVAERCREAKARRKLSQPQGVASCGSFFKNPPGVVSAGALIDQAGLKGVRVGDAQVSEKHGNFLINRGQATAREMIKLMQLVQSEVKEKHGLFLEPEVQLLGFAQGDAP
ncbi:MAG: UDP-N-acetylmuramate dehydrogenase [Thermodesulfobacteriota bacterium]